jgi:hypothetical protein
MAALLVACRQVLDVEALHDRTPSSGGPGDGGGDSSDAAAFSEAEAGPVSCSAANLLVCEDFENGIVAPPWEVDKRYGAIAADAVRAHRGVRSLHLRVDPHDASVGVSLRRDVTFPAQDFFVRIFLYMPTPGVVGPLALAVVSDKAFSSAAFLAAQNARLGTSVTPFADVRYAAESFSYDHWVCVEWELSTSADGLTRPMRVWQDDQPLAGAQRDDFPASTSLGSLWLQAYVPPQPTPVEIFLDDVAVDVARIGCAR